jgi:hypothetical protein
MTEEQIRQIISEAVSMEATLRQNEIVELQKQIAVLKGEGLIPEQDNPSPDPVAGVVLTTDNFRVKDNKGILSTTEAED